MSTSDIARRVARTVGLRISRNHSWNRFQAVEECLLRMKSLGYEPGVVIDVGANEGQFHRLVQPIFPSARYHLVEPQPACENALRAICRRFSAVEVHYVALSEPGVENVRLLGIGPKGGSTGAYVARTDERSSEEVQVRATTLDSLMSGRLTGSESALLKLDVESHELFVLRGADKTLTSTAAVLIEVSFFDAGSRGIPTFAEILTFLDRCGFVLYDIASLSGRPRDERLRQGDLIFVRGDSRLVSDVAWE